MTDNVGYKAPSREGAALRAEAESPFRVFRIVIFGFAIVSAGIATLFTIPSIIGSIGGAPNAKSSAEVGMDMGINVGAVALFTFLYRRDSAAREKQIDRLVREDELGACQLELANKRVLRLAQLRSFSRAVILAGSADQVRAALAAAEPFKADLVERGVLVIPLPMYGGTREDIDLIQQLSPDDLKWKACPIRTDQWKKWFDTQANAAGKVTAHGLYVGLRLDGRVRASGTGIPPWGAFVAQLPKSEGIFSGFLDGMDGRVGG